MYDLPAAFAGAVGLAAERYGEDAARRLLLDFLNSDDTVELRGPPGFRWVAHFGSWSNGPFLFIDGAWQKRLGLEAWTTLVSSLRIDFLDPAARGAALQAFRELAGPVMESHEDVDALIRPRRDSMFQVLADPHILDLFEPPHFEGRAFAFQANIDDVVDGPRYCRVVVRSDDGTVDVTVLGRGFRKGRE